MSKISELKNKLTSEKAHDFTSLCELVEILRSEEGCPWDREQDHKSIRSNIIEETYEVIEAIDNSDPKLLCEELGDVLLQIVFHSRIEKENGGFTVNEVLNGICEKMILRHPHVFGDVEVDGSAQVLDNWEKIKKAEKSRNTVKESMEAVPKQLPALMRTQKIAKKARKDGYKFGSDESLITELKSLTEALANADGENRKKILDKIVFISAIMNEADAEKGLSDLASDFIESYN